MSTKVDLADLIALAAAFAVLVAVVVVPTASGAVTVASHAPSRYHHRNTAPAYGFAPDRAPIPDSGYDWGNPDRGPYPQACGGGSC
jgi:hypothetical protein